MSLIYIINDNITDLINIINEHKISFLMFFIMFIIPAFIGFYILNSVINATIVGSDWNNYSTIVNQTVRI